MAEVKIYWREFNPVALDKNNVSKLNKILPPDFQLDLFEAKKPAVLSFFAKMMLNEILEKEFNIQNALSTFEKDRHGKPSIQIDNIHFNISHSKNIVVIAISEKAVLGIDVQFEKSFSLSILPKVFSEQEQQEFHYSEKQKTFFFETWSKKEASVKATGIGIKTGLNTFSVLENQVQLNNHNLHLKKIVIKKGYSAAIAVNHSISEITIKKLD